MEFIGLMTVSQHRITLQGRIAINCSSVTMCSEVAIWDNDCIDIICFDFVKAFDKIRCNWET